MRFQSCCKVDVDVGLSFLSTLGGHKDYAVGTTHTKYCSSRRILQNRNISYRIDVYTGHRSFNSVNQNQRLCVVPGAYATNYDIRIFLTRFSGGGHGNNTGQVTRKGLTQTGNTTSTLKGFT